MGLVNGWLSRDLVVREKCCHIDPRVCRNRSEKDLFYWGTFRRRRHNLRNQTRTTKRRSSFVFKGLRLLTSPLFRFRFRFLKTLGHEHKMEYQEGTYGDEAWMHNAAQDLDAGYDVDEWHRFLAKGKEEKTSGYRVDYSVLSVAVMTLGLIMVVEVVLHNLDHAAHGRPYFTAVLENIYTERKQAESTMFLIWFTSSGSHFFLFSPSLFDIQSPFLDWWSFAYF